MKIINQLYKIRNKWLDSTIGLRVWWILRIKRNSWASAIANQIIRKSQARKFGNIFTHIGDRWDHWMHPENGKASLLIALLIVFLPQIFLMFGVYRYIQPLQRYWQDPKAVQSTIVAAWQVLASLIGIAFVIIVFLTQYVVDRKFEKRAFPLFASRTWMVFTVMVGLFTLLSMGGNVVSFDLVDNTINPRGGINPEFLRSIAIYNLFLFGLNIILTIRLYFITYRLLSPEYFKSEFLKYLQKLVYKGVSTELRNRIMKKLVLDQCKQSGIDFAYLDNYPNKIRVFVPRLSKTINEIIDVNLDLLDMVSKSSKQISGNKGSKPILFLGEIGRRLSTEHPQIAYISSEYEHRYITYPLQNTVRLATVADLRRQSDANDDLVLSRDLLASAVRNGNVDEVDGLLDNYLETLKSFLKAFDAIGLYYNFELARTEGSIFSDWPFVKSIGKQYVTILDLVLKSDDLEIIQKFILFPFQVMDLAFHEKDHFLFRRFSNLYTTLYVRACRLVEDQEIKRYVKDHTWRLLVDFDQYRIAHAIENTLTSPQDQDIETITDYSLQILLVLNSLLKASIDQQDWDQYRLFTSAMYHIYRGVDGEYNQDHLEILDMQKQQFQEHQVPEAFQQEYRRSHAIVRQRNRLENTRHVLLIGIGAWLVHLFEAGRLTANDLKDHISTIDAGFLSAEDMYDVYCNYVPTGKIHDLTDWTSWELEEKPETPGEVTFSPLAFDRWLERYYVIRMLELMPTNEILALPDVKPFENSRGTLDTVKSQLTYLEKNPAWQDYLLVNEPIYKSRANALIRFHQTAADEQERLEEIELVNQPLDQNKIRAYKEEVEKSWLKSATLRKLFLFYGKYDPRPNSGPPDDLPEIGIEKLDEKAAYVNQNRIGYPDWGGVYGRYLGNNEDMLLSTKILDLELKIISEKELDNAIRQTVAEMKSSGFKPIILCERSILFGIIYKSPYFQTRWRAQNSLLEQLNANGLYEDCLVFSLGSLPNRKMVLLDFRSYANLVQYRPSNETDFPLYISVEEISPVKAKEILDKNPDWAKCPKTKEPISEEAALRRIQQHVIIQIWERFRLENINPEAGKVIQIIDVPDVVLVQAVAG